MNILETIRNDARGAMLLTDWLGHGGVPVSQEQAEVRALACISGQDGRPCDHNKEADWWERIKNKIATTIKKQLLVRDTLGLSVSVDEKLNMCSACGCCLRLKVWTPIAHVKQHTPAEKITELPIFCWQRKELEGI